jgi:hypothetical protein
MARDDHLAFRKSPYATTFLALPPAQRFSDYSGNSSMMMIITTQTPGSFGVNNFASVSPNFNRSKGFCNIGKLWYLFGRLCLL